MPDALFVTGLLVEGRHGVGDEERAVAQPFRVDLEIEVDLAAAATSDDLADTVDYAEVASAVEAIVREKSFALLERLADEIAGCVLGFPKVAGVTVTVSKLSPPVAVDVERVSAHICRTR